MFDYVIRGGTIVDGTGEAPYTADIGITDGKIVKIGAIEGDSATTIDANGLVVAPGFIDIHTHYDPHVMWDPHLSPSSQHGVTTVIGGNCGFTLAPLTPAAAEYLLPMLALVEGMPLESLRSGVKGDWSSFGEWLAKLDGAVAVNVGFLVGHTTVRRVVMDADSVKRHATPEELSEMVRLVHESLDQGALGFSSTLVPNHMDHNGTQVPSHWASKEEFVALSAAVRDHQGTTLEMAAPNDHNFNDELCDLFTSMSLAAGRPLNWNLLRISSDDRVKEFAERRLLASDWAAERGARVVALSLPEPLRQFVSFDTGFLYKGFPGWGPAMAAPLPERLKMFADPDTRRMLEEGTASVKTQIWTDWANMTVETVADPELKNLEGRRVGDIADESGRSSFDTVLDIVVADKARVLFGTSDGNDDESWRLRIELAQDPRVLVGGSDAGAHLDMLYTFAFYTGLLAEAVRERKLISLEAAVSLITDAPAQLYGLRGRGRIEEGYFADVIVFDADEIGPGPLHFKTDLPGGGGRLYSESTGIRHVLVNGVETIRDCATTGALSGTVLRSGRDTDTVGIPADQQAV
jgi:N-acyl-D-aspartate/D-glutamate deacylase